jgi:hypothetical protein
MSKIRAALLRRGFILGYRAGFGKARKDLYALAANFDAEVAALRNDFAEVVRDVHRFRPIERALNAERDFNARLH